MTISMVYECIVYCKSIARLRHECSYCETILMQVEEFGILLQMQCKFQQIGISEVCCIFITFPVVFFVKL